MPPIRLTDSELDVVMAAARPLPVETRAAFLQDVAAALANCNGNVGPGTIFRVCRDMQRKHFDPPDLARAVGSASK